MNKSSTSCPLTTEDLCPRHDKIEYPSWEHTSQTDLFPIPSSPTPRAPTPSFPVRPTRPYTNPTPSIPPQITRDPHLHGTTATRRCAYHRPGRDGPPVVLEEGEGKVGGRPADGLQGEEPDEGREPGVVEAPAGEQTRCEVKALDACQDCLPSWVGWVVGE
jgi:hypothetical protein